MGLFSRTPSLDTPAGVVAHFLKTDSNPAVVYFRGERKALTAEVEGAWIGRSREERLDSLKGSFRFFLTFAQPDTTPFLELDPEIQLMVALAGAKSRIIGFLWERTYGESMQHLTASWEPLSPEELRPAKRGDPIRAFQEGRPADWRPVRRGQGPDPGAD